MAFAAALILSTVSQLVTPAFAAGPASCSGNAIPPPQVFGTKVVDVRALEVRGYEYKSMIPPPEPIPPIDFCNVTVTYTHPGWEDRVAVYVWLPLEQKDWNGRFLAQGGGGWAAGNEGSPAMGILKGYAGAFTDAGHDIWDPTAGGRAEWTLHSPGVPNLPLIYDFSYQALDDMTKISKAVIESFYGKKPKYSYWEGCSTGGRQGMVQAQRFPGNYDGILAMAPAINWVSMVLENFWGQVIMNEMDFHPPVCESTAIYEAAVEACDELDGVKDGIVAAHGLCEFDPISVVGKNIDCDGKPHQISRGAAKVMKALWDGPMSESYGREWFGLPHEAPPMIPQFGWFGGMLNTECPEGTLDGKKCRGRPFPVGVTWIKFLLKKDPDFDTDIVTRDDLFKLFHQSRQEWTSVIDTADPQLAPFAAEGGKLIQWHGVADQLIPVNGSSNYYERVKALVPNTDDFYKYFEVPGVNHCVGGPGHFPSTALDALVQWVEKGKAPKHLDGEARDSTRPICPYPLVAAYKGGDVKAASSFECKEDFGAFGFPKQTGGEGSVKDEL